MGKVYFFTLSKKNIYSLYKSFPFFAVIIILNILYFLIFNPSENLSSNKLANVDITQHSKNIQRGELAIVIDDFGQNRNGIEEMLSIKRHLTFAIMPFLTFSTYDAETANSKGYEVIIHLPMESNYGKLSWVGPRPILSTMNDFEVKKLVLESFESVPYAVGANIHMGAKVGDDERIISDVLDVIKSKGLYFVDSRSSRHPVAKKLAPSKNVLCYDRNIFIDGKKPKEFIKEQLLKAGDLALNNGFAVAIGHVGTEGGVVTAEAINEMIPVLESKNVHLVFVSELPK